MGQRKRGRPPKVKLEKASLSQPDNDDEDVILSSTKSAINIKEETLDASKLIEIESRTGQSASLSSANKVEMEIEDNWVVEGNRDPNMGAPLHYVPSSMPNIIEEDIDELKQWEAAMVGCSIGPHISFPVMEKFE
ncbi:hypothetical protein Ancab_001678 [Ancistrocladus abbreviatus]